MGGSASKILGPVLGGAGTLGGLGLTAMGMPQIGVPLLMAGAGSGIGGALGGTKGMLEGGIAGGGVGAGLEGAGAGGMGIPGLAAKLGIGTPSAGALSSALASNPAMAGITPNMVQSFGPAMPPVGYNPGKVTNAISSLGGAANAGLSPVLASMNQQQAPQPQQRPMPQPIPVAQATVPQFQGPAQSQQTAGGDPLQQYQNTIRSILGVG